MGQNAKEFIQIPVDFQDLNELSELVNNYKFAQKLLSALNNYQEVYVSSMYKTFDEVLEYIPKQKQKEYKLMVRNEVVTLSFFKKREKQIGIRPPERDKKVDISDVNDKLECNEFFKKSPCLLVNTKDKIISVCEWKLGKRCNDLDSYWDRFEDLDYSDNKVKFDITKEILHMTVGYEYTDTRTEGGVTINAGRWNAYHSGGKDVEYTACGEDTYAFDTRTNTYLGFIKSTKLK